MKQKPAPWHGAPPTLRELQAEMQAAILGGSDGIMDFLKEGARARRDTLLGVYRHAYMARLIDVVANEHPLLRSYIGEDAFNGLARAFITAHPSRSPNARWVGMSFPEFVESHATCSGRPELAELAAIERAVSNAFDSADAPVLGVADLAAYEPSDWEHLTFVLHPSVTLLGGETNAFDIWKSLKDGEAPPAAEHSTRPELRLVWRQGVTPKVRRMPDEEAMLCREASRGGRFGALCQLLATFDDAGTAPVRAAQYLRGWVESEMLTAAKLVEPARSLRQLNPETST